MRRYLRLLWIQVRASLATAMQYRGDFLVDGLMSLWWMLWTLVPLWVVFRGRGAVAGWSFPEALLVAAWFTVLRGVLEGAINPSLVLIADQIRTGTLDFVLVKPADGQFLVSTAKFAPWKVFDLAAGAIMAVVAFERLGRAPAPGDVLLALVLLGTAVLVLYAMWILVVCASFWVVRLDNLAYLLSSIFDAARWPLDVFRGAWRALFTFVIPLGLMTTYPAKAMLGILDARTAVAAVGGSVAFALVARFTWTQAISRYTSASS
jgi:viologen exporter family transport system permease protein